MARNIFDCRTGGVCGVLDPPLIVSEQPMFWRKVSSGTNLDYQKCEMNLGQTKVCTIRQEYLLYVHDAQLSQVCFDYEQSTIDQKQSQCS